MLAIRKVIIGGIALLYPFLVYFGIQSGQVWLAPTIVAGILIAQAVRATNLTHRITKLGLAGLFILGIVFFQAFTAKLIPTLIQLLLMHFFGKTLLADNGPPLIERFARLEFSDIPAELLQYCRQLTWIWTGFFAFNALMCSALALWGPAAWWAFYTGFLMFVLMALLMLGEYLYRHFRFPSLTIPDIRATARNMILNSRQIWLDVQAR